MDGKGEVPVWLRLDAEPPQWFRAPISDLLDAWRLEVDFTRRWSGTATPDPVSLSGSLEDAVEEMTFTPRSALLVGLDAAWTACFRRSDGRVAGGWLHDLTPCEVACIEWSTDADGKKLGLWWQAAPSTRDEARGLPPPRRSVRLWREDGKWRFDQYGEPFDFEDVARYSKSRRVDRLDEATLLRYAHSLGIPLDRLDAYTGRAVLLHPQEWPDPPRERTEEGRKNSGIELCELVMSRIKASKNARR